LSPCRNPLHRAVMVSLARLSCPTSRVPDGWGQLERQRAEARSTRHDRFQRLPLTLFLVYLRLVCFRLSGEGCPLPARRRALRFHDPEPALAGLFSGKRAFSAPRPSVQKPDLWRTRHLPTPPVSFDQAERAGRSRFVCHPHPVKNTNRERTQDAFANRCSPLASSPPRRCPRGSSTRAPFATPQRG